MYEEIEPGVCPYCGKFETVRFTDAWIEEDTLIERYYCINCSKEYYVVYDFTNPRYQEK